MPNDNLQELQRQLAMFKAALDTLPNPIFIKDDALQFVFFNRSYTRFFHLKEGQYLGWRVEDLPYLSDEDRQRYHDEDQRVLDECSEVHYETNYPSGNDLRESLYWSKGFQTQDGAVRGIIGEIVDISREKQLAHELKKRVEDLENVGRKVELESLLDTTTGLFNRKIFKDKIPNFVENCHELNISVAVMFFDIDNFKQVNDDFGHAVGDDILRQFSALLRRNIRCSDFGIRYGGDEFILVLSGITGDNLRIKADRIRREVEGTLLLPDESEVTVSIGIAVLEKDEDIAAGILHADEALYSAKESGRNDVVIYTPRHAENSENAGS